MSAHTPGPQPHQRFAVSAARAVFRKRGNHSEAHLSESDLAIIIEAALEAFGAPDLLAACEEVAEHLARGRCRCTLAEVESGHHVDCWKPEAEAAAEKFRAAISKARGK